MKALLTIFGVLFLFSFSQAQNSIAGQILEKQNQVPIVGANIYIPDLQIGSSTNFDGKFEITNVPKGIFLIEVSYVSYSSQVLKIEVDGTVQLNIELSPSVTEMSEIVITGTSSSTRRESNPIPSIVLTNLSKNESGSSNIIDILARQPGISQISTGSSISKPVIRGLSANRVVVINNNIRQEGQQWGDEHGIEIDQYAVDRVEIIKGPGSLSYGSDAMAGVIHFLDPKPVESGMIKGNISGNFQSNNNLVGFSAVNSGNIDGINWLARISTKNAGNYFNKYDGKVHNSGFREINFNSSFGLNKKWGYTKFHVSNFNQFLGLPEGERDEDGRFVRTALINNQTFDIAVPNEVLNSYEIGLPRQQINHLKFSSSTKLFLDGSALAFNFGYQQNQRKEFANIFDADEEELNFLLNSYNYEIKYQLFENFGWQTSFGLNGMFQTSENRGEEFIIPAYQLFDLGFYGITQKSFEKMLLSGGIRYDYRIIDSEALYFDINGEPTIIASPNADLKFTGFNTSFSNVSGSFGLSYIFSETFSGKLNISRGFRTPNLAELGSNGIHEGTFRYELGNENLKAETSLQLDAGILLNSEHVSIELALFNNSINDYIFLQRLSNSVGNDSIINIDDPAPSFKFIQGNARLFGGELAIDIHPHPLDFLHFENSFSIVKGRQLNQPEEFKFLPFIPAPRLQSELRANFNEFGSMFSNLFFRLEFSHIFDQNEFQSAFETETFTDGYSLFNSGFGADVIGKNQSTLFSFSLLVTNLLDKAYQSHLSRLKYAPENLATNRIGIYNMGRNISLKINFPLTFKKKQ